MYQLLLHTSSVFNSFTGIEYVVDFSPVHRSTVQSMWRTHLIPDSMSSLTNVGSRLQELYTRTDLTCPKCRVQGTSYLTGSQHTFQDAVYVARHSGSASLTELQLQSDPGPDHD